MKKLNLIFLFFPLFILAQQQVVVKGTVLDEENKQLLPGVTILEKGTKNGAITDFDGFFEINTKLGATLSISYLGMKTQEIVVESETLKIYLQTNLDQLDEVVVSVGYFDVSKKDLSGSISQVTTEKLEQNRTSSVEQLLQGQISGVVISDSSEPGGGTGISIRGTNSLLGGTQPLYVVDGIPIDPLTDAEGNTGGGQAQNSIAFLNPNDIDKIEVLKDAAATAIYGARGANGVIIITTKSADTSNGKDSFTVNIDSSVNEVIDFIDVLDGPQFESYMNQRALNQLYVNISNPDLYGSGAFDGSQALDPAVYTELSGYALPYPETTGVSNNWQDITYRMAYSNAYNLSYTGGNRKNNIFTSLGIQNQEGVISNTNNRRITSNTNIRRKMFNDKVDLIIKTNIAHNSGNASSVANGEIFQQRGVVSQALRFQPIFDLLSPGEDDDAYADLNENQLVSNPYTLATLVQDHKKSVNFGQALALITKIKPKVTWTVKGFYNLQRSNRDTYYPTSTTRGRRNNGEASQSYLQNEKMYGETSFRYRNRFGKHRIDAILVGTVEQNKIRAQFNKAFGFGSDATSYYTFESATDILVPISQFRDFGLLSGLARIGYNYDQKYYVDINARVDASSKFAKNNKSAIFPSIALAWAASEEDFLMNSNTISNLRFRLSYGKTGSNPIAPYQSLALMTPIRYNFNDELVTGYYESNLANDDLTWETTDQANFGIDLGLFNSKVNLTIDAYHKTTKNLLQNVTLPASNGFVSIVDNFGEIENKGIEFALNAELINSNDFDWNVSGNISFNRNKLLKLNSNLDFQLGPSVGFSQANPIVFQEGQPLGIFWGAQTDGIYENWDEAIASGIDGATPGEIKYVNNHVDLDVNGDPLPVQQINFDDYVQIGDPNPDFTAAITNNFIFKNWDLSFLITGQKGGDIFWVDSWGLYGNQQSTNVLQASFNDSWTAPLSVDSSTGTVVYDPSVGQMTGVQHPAPLTDAGQRALASDRQVFDGSFIRLKNLNLGYTLNMQKGRSLRLYLSGNNLLTWTKYPGYDPEIQSYNKDPQRRGVDFGSYPGTRRYTLGLRFNY